MARNGKIARMSLDIRNELNRRLQNGEAGTALVEWLNGNARVQAVLAEQFDGRPVNEQNLSDWRQGGYQDWLRLEAARDFIENMSEQSDVLDDAAGEELISDCFGPVLAAEMAQMAMKFLEQDNDLEKRWERLKEINREFSRMRRDDHRALRTWIKQAQWERQQEQEEDAAEDKRRRRERVASLFGAIRGTAPAPAPAKPVLTKSPIAKVRPPSPNSGAARGPKSGGAREDLRSKQDDSSGRSLKPKVAGKVAVLEDTSSPGTGRMAAPGTGALQPESGKSGRINPNQGKSRLKKTGEAMARGESPESRGVGDGAGHPDAGVTIKVQDSEFRVQGSKTCGPGFGAVSADADTGLTQDSG